MSRTELLQLRLTPKEKAILLEVADRLGITLTEFARNTVLDYAKMIRDNEDLYNNVEKYQVGVTVFTRPHWVCVGPETTIPPKESKDEE